MREIAVAIQNDNQKVSVADTIKAIKQAGFTNVFVQWYDKDWAYSQQKQVDLCKELGLTILFAHLGYQNMKCIWEEGEEGDELVKRFKNDIKSCQRNEIPMVVMHLIGGDKDKAPTFNEIGLARIREIVDYAKQLSIKVAFENTKNKGYLEYVLQNIKDEHVGICFDSGHYHIYFQDEFDFDLFKDRIFAVHLHDNDKSDDLHLLPFEGTIDWQTVIKRLKESNYNGPVTLELCYRYHYLNETVEEFYQKGYQVGEQLAQLFER